MKKKSFFSIHRPDHNPTQAVLHEGYTDGRFNYYKGCAGWVAVCPEIGLSVANAKTRKECVEIAYSEYVQDALNLASRHPAWKSWCESFDKLVRERKARNTRGDFGLITYDRR